jgi:hypothetical protein
MAVAPVPSAWSWPPDVRGSRDVRDVPMVSLSCPAAGVRRFPDSEVRASGCSCRAESVHDFVADNDRNAAPDRPLIAAPEAGIVHALRCEALRLIDDSRSVRYGGGR